MLIATATTALLVLGTTESATVNAVLVVIKITALTVFCLLALPVIKGANFTPSCPPVLAACRRRRPRSSSPMSVSTRFRRPLKRR
jgi:amino acid transporter